MRLHSAERMRERETEQKVRDGGEEEGYYGEIREEEERANKREGERDKETEKSRVTEGQ